MVARWSWPEGLIPVHDFSPYFGEKKAYIEHHPQDALLKGLEYRARTAGADRR